MSRIFSSAYIVRPLVVAALLLSMRVPLHAQDAGALSLGEALQLAAERSQALVAREAAAAAARDLAVAAGERPDPTLTAAIDNLPINGPDELSLTRDFMTMRSIGLMRELTRDDKRDARAARFEREAELADAGRLLALAALERDTAAAWLDRYYRERMHAVLATQRTEAALQVDAADIAYRSRQGSQSDVFAARSAVAEIDDRIAAAERDVEIATIRLARWIGDAADRPLAEPPATGVVAVNAANLEAELAHHPMLAVLAKQEEVARAEAEIARTNKRPDWTVAVMYSARGSSFSDMVSVNVSRPLQWRQRNRQDRELSAKLALSEQMRAEREEETRAHLAETQALLHAWRNNRERLGRYASSLIPLTSERTRAAIAAYRGGNGTLESVLDARAAEIATGLDELALERETAQLWAELNYLIPAGVDASMHGGAATQGAGDAT
ncbi:MAG TPA: TolC family protein [Gammaproteobacteria bacterium]